MRRVLALIAALGLGAGTVAVSTAGADDTHEYLIELDNAFGLVEGSEVRIGGVNAGTVKVLDVNEAKRALITVELSGPFSVLGQDSICSSEPNSLIAEYFIDCQPAGEPLEDGGTIPVEQTRQTVQNDLVLSTMREPFKRRLQLLINEFGTALAGNPEALNDAIRRGAPTLEQLQQVTDILADQNRIITRLNEDSDVIFARLNERREDIVEFIDEAEDTATVSASRRDELSRNFELLDDFLAELEPTLADLETLAVEQTPLLTDLRAAAPQLTELATSMPAFNIATAISLESLGEAGVIGRRALTKSTEELDALREASENSVNVAEYLSDFLRDIDDPHRAVEIDERVKRDTGRSNSEPNQPDTMGYTGLEGLLNYVYYQAGALNQFDTIGHLLHFSLYEFEAGPCGGFQSGRDPETGEPGVPAADGSTTTDLVEAHPCVSWVGPNQPGISEELELPPYDPSVCPDGVEPEAALEICNPDGEAHSATETQSTETGEGGEDGEDGTAPAPGEGDSGVPAAPDTSVLPEGLDDLLDIPGLSDELNDLGQGLQEGLQGGLGEELFAPQSENQQTDGELLDFLFGP